MFSVFSLLALFGVINEAGAFLSCYIKPRCRSTAIFSGGAILPSGAKVLSTDPLVYVIPNLLSEEECDNYIERVTTMASSGERPMTRSNPPEVSIDRAKLWPLPFLSLLAGVPAILRLPESPSSELVFSTIFPPIGFAFLGMLGLIANIVPLIQRFSDSSSRTSDAMALNLDGDLLFIRNVVDRICGITSHPWEAWEAPVVTKYAPGAIFARHGDASPTRGSEWSSLGSQRIITCICYLNNVLEGGETSFDRLNLDVKPEKGSALVFFPADAETLVADDRTTHESLPPTTEKWILQMFGRVGPRVPPPLGLPDSYGA